MNNGFGAGIFDVHPEKGKMGSSAVLSRPATTPTPLSHIEITGQVLNHFSQSNSFKAKSQAEIWQALAAAFYDKEKQPELLHTIKEILPNQPRAAIDAWAQKMFPDALHKKWLDKQPVADRFALLIGALRTRNGLSIEALSRETDISTDDIVRLETKGQRSSYRLTTEQRQKLWVVFSSDPLISKVRFTQVFKVSHPYEKSVLPTQAAAPISNIADMLPEVVGPIDFTAEPIQILREPQEQRAGKYYAAWARKAEVTYGQIATATGMGLADVKQCLDGTANFPEDKIEPASTFLASKSPKFSLDAFQNMAIGARIARERLGASTTLART